MIKQATPKSSENISEKDIDYFAYPDLNYTLPLLPYHMVKELCKRVRHFLLFSFYVFLLIFVISQFLLGQGNINV